MILRATAKQRALLRPPVLATVNPAPEDWYGTLLWIEGRKCILLVHADTLFPIFAADIRATDLRSLATWLATLITSHLDSDGLPPDALGPRYRHDVSVAKTASRHVLGVMNDMAFHTEIPIADEGGLARHDNAQLNRELRRGLHQRDRCYISPLELVADHGGR